MSNKLANGSMPAIVYVEAEYDHDNNKVVALKTESGSTHATHNPRVLGAKTEWLAVETKFPEGYDTRFDYLLQRSSLSFTYDKEKNRVIVEFPKADFSPKSIRSVLQEMVNQHANNELRNTDWYVIRKMETGKPIPSEVSAERERIRKKAEQYTASLARTSDAGLASFSVTFGEEPEAPKEQAEPVAKGGDGREWRTDATEPGQEGKPLHPEEGGIADGEN